jgi:ABC-type spermidine/putrescine transport system permease subunit I
MMRSRFATRAAFVPATALVAAFVLAPLLLVVRTSLYRAPTGSGFYVPDTVSLAAYGALLDGHGLRLAAFTLLFGAATATLATGVAFPLALVLRTFPPRRQAVALAAILVPKTAGLLATMFGLQRLLPRGTLASLVAEAYLVLPYAVLVLAAHLATLDPTWEQAARGLGASRRDVFLRITWPLARPGVALAFELALMWGLGAFLGPLFLGGPDQTTLSVEIHHQAFDYGRWPRAAALAVELLALAALAVAAALVLPRTRRSAA